MTNRASITVVPPMLAALLLAGCAGNSERYPSLAVRDAERISGTLTPAPAPEAPATPVQTVEQIDDALGNAVASYQRFQAAQSDALALAQSASGSGSEEDVRARALIALADLTSIRSETALALADLDRLEIEAASEFAKLQDIHAAQARVERFVREQDAAIAAIDQALSR